MPARCWRSIILPQLVEKIQNLIKTQMRTAKNKCFGWQRHTMSHSQRHQQFVFFAIRCCAGRGGLQRMWKRTNCCHFLGWPNSFFSKFAIVWYTMCKSTKNSTWLSLQRGKTLIDIRYLVHYNKNNVPVCVAYCESVVFLFSLIVLPHSRDSRAA